MRPPTRYALLVAFGAYLLLVARITLTPGNPNAEFEGLLGWLVDALTRSGMAHRAAYVVTEAAANVAMFVPFGLFLALLTRHRHRWLAVVVPALTSVGIETTQLALLPDRVATPQDVVMNTLGAALGVLVHVTARAAARHRPRPHRDTPG